MKLLLVSHKPCWPSTASPSGYATDGGFPMQVRALSELFESTTVAVPCAPRTSDAGEMPLVGRHLTIAPLTAPSGTGRARTALLPLWVARNAAVLLREIRSADAVHVPIPGDIGTVGMLLAYVLRKPLFVRHCGNWFVPRTAAERFWKWFMQRAAGGRNVMLATGGHAAPPSQENLALRWIFSTTLTESELAGCSVRRDSTPRQGRLVIACRQEEKKGTDIVIDSLPLVLRRFPGATLDIVGSGGALAALKRRAESLGCAGRVTFHGKVDHATVIRLLQQAEVFCYPTAASEGFPKVVLEALACGLPVIATRVSVLPHLLASGCGILLDSATPEALAAAVIASLESGDRYRAMSVSAVETARQYSLERWTETIATSLSAAWGELRPHA